MPRLILAFILLLAMLSGRPVMADLLDEDIRYADVENRLHPLKTWDELCAVVNCDRFPKGYSTWKLGEEYYYFRIEATMPPPEPGELDFRNFDPMLGRFVELDGDGRMTRSFAYHSQTREIRFVRCCKWLLDQVGLLGQWPDFTRYWGPESPNDPFRRDTASLELIWTKYYGRQDHAAAAFPENPDGTKQQALDQADKSNWISLNEDFWLTGFGKEIHDSRDPENRYRMVRLLSKEPIFNGRYISGFCDFVQTCSFTSVMFADSNNPLPGITIAGLRADEYQARACDDPNPVLNCDVGLAFFDKLKPAFQTLERMSERMKLRPDDIELK